MSISAEKEKQMENKIAGVGGKSKAFWTDHFVTEFALMARKLRKSAVDAKGNKVEADLYTPIIERKLAKVDAAITLLEQNPQLAQEFGESGAGIEDIMELIERKAAEMDTEEQVKGAAEKVRRLLPGARLNALVKKSRGASGGLVSANAAGDYVFDDAKLFA